MVLFVFICMLLKYMLLKYIINLVIKIRLAPVKIIKMNTFFYILFSFINTKIKFILLCFIILIFLIITYFCKYYHFIGFPDSSIVWTIVILLEYLSVFISNCAMSSIISSLLIFVSFFLYFLSSFQ